MSVTVTQWPHSVPEPKDPAAVLNYVIDWSDWLQSGQSITSATWSASDSTVDVEASSVTGTEAAVVISGGTNGGLVHLTCHVVDDSTPVALEDDRTLIIRIRDR